MSLVDVNIEGSFTDEPREELSTSLELMPSAQVTVAVCEPLIDCAKCQRSKTDYGHEECIRGGEHEFTTPPLEWVDRIRVKPDAANDDMTVWFRPTGKEHDIRVVLKPDAETGKIRMVVESTSSLLPLHQVDAEEANGRRTDFLIG